MWFTDLPADWQAELAKKIGGNFRIELILDPDGSGVLMNDERDISAISQVISSIDLDPQYGREKAAEELTVTLDDPDGYFDSNTVGGLFHDCCAELLSDAVAGDLFLTLKNWTDVNLSIGETITINDGTHSETFTVSAFAFDVDHFVLGISTALTYDYAANTRVYTQNIEGRTIQVSLASDNCATKIPLFRGRLVKRPEVSRGKATLTLSSYERYLLDQKVIGADSDSAKKLMIIGTDGLLKSSIKWTGGWGDPPYNWSIDSGDLPTSFDIDASTGEISGTTTDTGTFLPVVKVENSAGQVITQEITLRVVEILAEEFSGAYGPYTAGQDSALWSLVARSGWARCAFTSKYLNWKTAINDDSQNLRRTDMSGDWCLIVKVEINSAPAVGYQAGAAVKFSTGEGFIFGYYNATNRIVFRRITETSGFTYDGTDAGYAGGREFLLKKVGSNYAVYHRAPGDTSWGSEWGSKSDANTVESVGVAIVTESSGSGTFDIDFARLVIGSLSFVSSAISNGKIGVPYSCFVEAQGGSGEYTYSISDKSLPVGFSINTGTGEISGNPVEAKDTTFTVQVTDSLGATATQEFTIAISDGNVITPSVLRRAIKSTAYSATLNVNPTGSLDRALVVIGARCPCGKWTIEFTSATAYKIEGPGYTSTSDIGADFEIDGVIEIPAAAWSGGITLGDSLSFFTAKSWEEENPVTVISGILASISGLPSSPAGDTFSEEEDYCNDNSFILSLSVDREMTYAQLIEVILMHFNGFMHFDNYGVAQLCSMRKRSEVVTAPEFNEDIILAETVSSETREVINEIAIDYAYDYDNEKTTQSLIYPPEGANRSHIRHGFIKSVKLTIPGAYSQALVEKLAKAIYAFFENGPTYSKLKTNLLGVSIINGDVATVDDDLYKSPGNCVVTGKRIDPDNFEVELEVADWKAFDNERHL